MIKRSYKQIMFTLILGTKYSFYLFCIILRLIQNFVFKNLNTLKGFLGTWMLISFLKYFDVCTDGVKLNDFIQFNTTALQTAGALQALLCVFCCHQGFRILPPEGFSKTCWALLRISSVSSVIFILYLYRLFFVKIMSLKKGVNNSEIKRKQVSGSGS